MKEEKQVTAYLEAVGRTLQQLSGASIAAIERALLATYDCDSTIFTCGNGGSAATSSHFALDLAKGTRPAPAKRLVRALALTDSAPLLTAWANDTDYAQVFARQLEVWFRPGDLLFAISASGNSGNVLSAAEFIREHQGVVCALTGYDGGKLAPLATHALIVPSDDIELIEDCHSVLCHQFTRLLRERIAAV
ncbi:MAG: SIS domain-containing protein [Chloroflexi bacterium]|nr:SIS domain-containing protein [Chloroflexota bacterium]